MDNDTNPEPVISAVAHLDGTLTIRYADLILTECYTCWDDGPMRPTSIQLEEFFDHSKLTYVCAEGTLELKLISADSGIELHGKLIKFSHAPSRLLLLGSARVQGASHWLQNGYLRPFPNSLEAPVKDDYGLVNAIVSSSGHTLAFGPHDLSQYRVAGLVTGSNAYTNGFFFSQGFHLENLPIPPEGLTLPTLSVSAGQKPFPTLRNVARKIATKMGARNRFGAGNHWCSWYQHYYNFSHTDLTLFLAGLKNDSSAAPNLRAVQIDAGYFTSPGDWLSPNERWPDGLAPAFTSIAEAGFLPGVWIAPYMAGNRSKLFAEHSDWILRRHDGSPVIGIEAHGEDKTWGYRDEEWYVLDSSHPGVTEHIVHCLKTLHQWGAKFFKTDFLFWAFFEPGDNQVRRYAPGLSSMQRMRTLLAAMREAMGVDSFWLGCLAPFPPMVGFADALRTGGDNASIWPVDLNHSGHSASHLIHSSWAMQFINGILWQNDADALILRDTHTKLSDEETVSLALWVAALGGAVNTSDPLASLPFKRKDLWRFCTQGSSAGMVELPFWGLSQHALPVIVREYPEFKAWSVLIVNILGTPMEESFNVSELIGVTSAVQIAPWSCDSIGKLEPATTLRVMLPSHHHCLYWVSAIDKLPPPGFTLGGALLST